MTMRLGANPIGWSDADLPKVGGDTPLENPEKAPALACSKNRVAHLRKASREIGLV